MNKVELTREQARGIEDIKLNSVFFNIEKHENKNWSMYTELNELTMEELALALFVGYEIKEEFKVGDWVTDKDEERRVTGIITRIDNERGLAWGYFSYTDKETNFDFTEIRHATPEEIAEEKERRWWAKHGREVWELKVGDIVIWKKGTPAEIYEVTKINEDEIVFHDKGYELKRTVKSEYKILCFAEDRLDLNE